MKRIIFVFLVLASGWSYAVSASLSWSWHAPKTAQSLLLDMTVLPNGNLLAVGERGHIIISTDRGENWVQSNVPTRSTLTSIYFVDNSHGWAAGYDTEILYTADGGLSWTEQHRDIKREQPVFGLYFKDRLNGYAVGGYGLFLQTRDGGKTWQDIELKELDDPAFGLPHLYSILGLKNGALIMAGEAGTVAIKPPRQPWHRISTGYDGSFFDIKLIGDNVLLAVGLRGHIYRSHDLGVTWRSITSHTDTGLFNITLVPQGGVIVSGADGVILVSFDNAQHFSIYRRPDRHSMMATEVLPAIAGKTGAATVITVGQGGVADISSYLKQARH